MNSDLTIKIMDSSHYFLASEKSQTIFIYVVDCVIRVPNKVLSNSNATEQNVRYVTVIFRYVDT